MKSANLAHSHSRIPIPNTSKSSVSRKSSKTQSKTTMENKSPPSEDMSRVPRPNLNYDFKSYRKRGKSYEPSTESNRFKPPGITFDPDLLKKGLFKLSRDRGSRLDPESEMQSLYQRPDYIPQPRLEPICTAPPEWKTHSYGYSTKRSDRSQKIEQDDRWKIPRSSEKDVDNMLAKYNKRYSSGNNEHYDIEKVETIPEKCNVLPAHAPQQWYQDKDPDFRKLGYDADACSMAPSNSAKMQYGKCENMDNNNRYLANLAYLSNINTKQTSVLKPSLHTFPFQETQDGFLVVLPDQIAFESKKISVLVSDPKGTKIDINSAGQNLSLFGNESPDEESETDLAEKEALSKFFEALKSSQQSVLEKDNASETSNTERKLYTHKYSSSIKGSDAFVETIHRHIRNSINPDTHVMIGNKAFPCHALALQSCSRRFEKLFRPREAVHKIEISEADVPAKAFPPLMDWILQPSEEKTAVVNATNVVALYAAAKYLEIPELQQHCLTFLQSKVEAKGSQLMQVWDEVKARPNCFELMNVLVVKAATSFPEIYKTGQFLQMDVEELILLLSSDEIVIESELQVCDAAVQWLLLDWEGRKQHVNGVMKTVRFGLLTPLQLTQIGHCPDAKGYKKMKEFQNILHMQSVKEWMDQGLKYAILSKSYDSPEELAKWIESTGIVAPRPRKYMLENKQLESRISPCQVGNTVSSPFHGTSQNPASQESYTVIPQKSATRPATSAIPLSRRSKSLDKNALHKEGHNWVAPIVMSPTAPPSKIRSSRSSFEQMAMRPPIKEEDLPWVASNLHDVDLNSPTGSTTGINGREESRKDNNVDDETTAVTRANNEDQGKN